MNALSVRVAVIGRPNVGKSTLVNRLAARRGSISGPSPGVTRDRLQYEVSWGGKDFILEDTGGLGEIEGDDDPALRAKVASAAEQAGSDADLILFVVDSQVGSTEEDLTLARRLRGRSRPVILVANKVDDQAGEADAAELWGLGLGEPAAVSALHGRGSGDLLDRIVDLLPPAGSLIKPEVPSIALVGRPNVGKSSLLNRILGSERAIVHHVPGTTRDAVDSLHVVSGQIFRFVDTAGLRRRSKTAGLDSASAARTRASIERSDVAVLVIDAAEGAAAQDQHIAESIADAGTAAIIALNKWDLIADPESHDAVHRNIEDRLAFLSYAPLVRTSAKTGRGISRLLSKLEPVVGARHARVPTSRLNTLLQEAQQHTPPPPYRGKRTRVLYATQVGVAPPNFVLFASGRLPPTWVRYFERVVREEFGFEGNPLRVTVRERRSRPG